MIQIAHRGNINGPHKDENNPAYVDIALGAGYSAEIDLWLIDNVLLLGHDIPQYVITPEYLNDRTNKLWIHAKNHESLRYLTSTNHNYFWHNKDDYTMTSKGYLWAYPRMPALGKLCICVSENGTIPIGALGICSDFINTK